jgi:uncharacterized membrane protein
MVASESALDRTFRISIGLKGLDGLLEIVGSVVLLFVAPATLQSWARTLTAHELAQDRHDFIATHLLHSASQLSRSTTLFAAIYLLSHGIAKVVLVIALLRNQLWAYPWMIALLGIHRVPALPPQHPVHSRADVAHAFRHLRRLTDRARKRKRKRERARQLTQAPLQ